jgi:hypothetical protein
LTVRVPRALRRCRTVVAVVALVVAMVVAAGFVSVENAQAAYHFDNLDSIASRIAGVPLTVMGANEWEWPTLTNGNDGVVGLTCFTCGPSAGFYVPSTGYYSNYRTIWLAPSFRQFFQSLPYNGLYQGMDYLQVGKALLTLNHEAQHWRLFSHNEGRVNACALADLPRMLSVDFNVPAQVDRSVHWQQSYRVKVRQRVRLHGRYVYRYVTKTRTVWGTKWVDNPVMTGILEGARAFYASQPFPYNAGTC